jgi:type IV secretion system protein VirB5
MKRIAFAVAFGVATMAGGISQSSAAGIPVIDVAKIANDSMNQAANIAKYIEMINQYKTQIDQMKQQYDSLTGSRGLGMIMNNPELRSYIPAEWQEVYYKISNDGYQGLSGSAQAILDANKLLTACQRRGNADKIVCERQVAKAAQDKAWALEAFDKAADRWDQIQGLMSQINSTTDPKAIAELQARINAEQAAIQNEQTKLQMFQMLAQVEDRLIEQQQREINSRDLARRGYVRPAPVNFGN